MKYVYKQDANSEKNMKKNQEFFDDKHKKRRVKQS